MPKGISRLRHCRATEMLNFASALPAERGHAPRVLNLRQAPGMLGRAESTWPTGRTAHCAHRPPVASPGSRAARGAHADAPDEARAKPRADQLLR
eukprot:8158654-Alexandrium_andersonii.AAC.1